MIRVLLPLRAWALCIVTCTAPACSPEAGSQRPSATASPPQDAPDIAGEARSEVPVPWLGERFACASATARQVLADETGEALAQVYDAHRPSVIQTKIVATWWISILAANETGALDPALLSPELQNRVAEVVASYTHLFEGCEAAPVELAAARQPLIDGTRPFSCDEYCVPSAFALKQTLTAVVDATALRTIQPVQDLYAGLSTLSNGLQSAKSAEQEVVEVIDRLMSEASAHEILKSAAPLVTSAGAVASAALLVGATGPALTLVAEAGAVVGVIALGVAIAEELAAAHRLVSDCRRFQALHCGSCTCSAEVLDYSDGIVTSECLQWAGAGPSAFCLSIADSANQCCTCTDAARAAFSDCGLAVSFDPEGTSADHERCCIEAAGVLNAKGAAPPSCPCSAPMR